MTGRELHGGGGDEQAPVGCPPSGWELQGAVHLFVRVFGPGRLGTGAPAQESAAVQTKRSERLRPGVGGWFSRAPDLAFPSESS